MAASRRSGLADPRLPYGILAVLLLALAVLLAVVRLLGLDARILYTDLPRVEQPLPGAVSADAGERSATVANLRGPPATDGPEIAGAPPVDVPDSLLRPGRYGALPRRADDGRDPFSVYRSAFRVDPEKPRIALVVIGLGLARTPTLTATELPPVFGLAFSPYGRDLAGWMRYARRRGHEVLMELPVRPARFPLDDAGPLALGPTLPPERLRQRLETVLAAGKGYLAVVAAPGAYAAEPDKFDPVVTELATAGLGLVELGGTRLADIAARRGLPYAWSDPPIDLDPAPEAIDLALGRLETRALRDGAALGTLEGTAIAYARLRQWVPSLEAKGLQLVAPSRIFADRSGRSPE